MNSHVEIVEVGARDGLQSIPDFLPTSDKIGLIERLVDCGVRRLEVASFVNPKRVPQMADAEAVLAGLRKRDDVHYIGLVLNRRGFDRALAAGCNEVGLVAVASDTFGQKNQGAGIEEALADCREILDEAREAGLRAQVTVSVAFGCPYEGEIPAQCVVDIARRLAEWQPLEIALADTIGVAVPARVTELIGRVREAVPHLPLRCHFHNTRNTAVANAWAAWAGGVRVFDSSVGGLGGCPFAPNATGNVATEDLLYLFQRSGNETGIDLQRMIATARWLEARLNRPLPGMVARAGGFPK